MPKILQMLGVLFLISGAIFFIALRFPGTDPGMRPLAQRLENLGWERVEETFVPYTWINGSFTTPNPYLHQEWRLDFDTSQEVLQEASKVLDLGDVQLSCEQASQACSVRGKIRLSGQVFSADLHFEPLTSARGSIRLFMYPADAACC
ncbi:hypothetical protein [Arcanobacterium haemolyticum]|uniref:Uncharacterized protein n=1 Tax=Arcanobacterium haemolyticum (strain ATCC 9345 / DSM 20595 / CCM 5947 / CCUG 17215 / LMG 16163 / NBRC 15585 / NCTC 8452 / 11018) TaxID=644284 RepID=D7BNE0_ARCHD|nr:hypothetical protein [Arcanobacterium haemolyticum]ADH92439.1 hypothetical protein Arch_0706 [Arcanobacterium haemolyticum DSM 20595]SQH28832.1 Uncharacterised protein [Arcanobacterium haemolyticum]